MKQHRLNLRSRGANWYIHMDDSSSEKWAGVPGRYLYTSMWEAKGQVSLKGIFPFFFKVRNLFPKHLDLEAGNAGMKRNMVQFPLEISFFLLMEAEHSPT